MDAEQTALVSTLGRCHLATEHSMGFRFWGTLPVVDMDAEPPFHTTIRNPPEVPTFMS